MKKAWTTPEMESVNIMDTAYAPHGGTHQDGTFTGTINLNNGTTIPVFDVPLYS